MIRRKADRAESLVRAWIRSVAFTMSLSLLVAWGVGDEGQQLPITVVAVAALGLGLLYTVFPRGLHFAFGTATGLALYASLFVVLGRAQFPDAYEWVRAPTFVMPVAAFLGMVWARRHRLSEIAEAQESRNLDHLPHAARWLVFAAGVGVVCFVLPVNRLEPAWQSVVLVVAMGAIAVNVAWSVRDVVRLLVDVAVIVEELGFRLRRLLVPAVAFLLMYVLLVIGFASVYRIADSLSLVEIFHGQDGPIRLSYSDSLHFSIVTQSTVGYGDIRPHDDGIRVLASLQVIGGQLLLLFGFAEIMQSRRARAEPRLPERLAGRGGEKPAQASPKAESKGEAKGEEIS